MSAIDFNANTNTANVPGNASPVRDTASTVSTQNPSITATDFMKLLVTEMKNQDPTQPTDPNAYIQQLVGVNSLQQLIAINGELGSSAVGNTSVSGA